MKVQKKSSHSHWGVGYFHYRQVHNRASIPFIGYSIQYAYIKLLNYKWCTHSESMRTSIDQASYICHMTHRLSHDPHRLPYPQRSIGDKATQGGPSADEKMCWSIDEGVFTIYQVPLTLTNVQDNMQLVKKLKPLTGTTKTIHRISSYK